MERQQVENNARLEELFHEQLKDIYWAEKHLLKALPRMEKAATSRELRAALAEHLAVTQEHVERLEEVFGLLGHKLQVKKCEGLEGLIKEGESMIQECEIGSATRDVAIILAAQKVELYEIAAYGGLAQLARTLQHDEVAELLGTTLAEEKEADETLTEIAENNIIQEATAEV